MARIVEHLSVAELEGRYRTARDATEARHTQAIWLLAQGRTFLEVAEVLAALSERLRAPPEDGGRWTGPKVAAWMAGQLGVERVHPQRGWEALQRVRWSPQMPRPRHPRAATAEERAGFKGGSARRSDRPRPRTPAGASRSGRRTSTASA
jgi:hypothetical protein